VWWRSSELIQCRHRVRVGIQHLRSCASSAWERMLAWKPLAALFFSEFGLREKHACREASHNTCVLGFRWVYTFRWSPSLSFACAMFVHIIKKNYTDQFVPATYPLLLFLLGNRESSSKSSADAAPKLFFFFLACLFAHPLCFRFCFAVPLLWKEVERVHQAWHEHHWRTSSPAFNYHLLIFFSFLLQRSLFTGSYARFATLAHQGSQHSLG
jgi:hypothetical protein